MHSSWNKVLSNCEIKTDQKMISLLSLPKNTVKIDIYATHSGYRNDGYCTSDPDNSVAPEEEMQLNEITDAYAIMSDGNTMELSAEQKDLLSDSDSYCDLILQSIIDQN